tara:strand:- start:59 stop:595 length:537 start_codon:yes stop_codon:yes gene_type:complete
MAKSKEQSNGLKQDYMAKDKVRKHEVTGCVVVDRPTKLDKDEVDLVRAKQAYPDVEGLKDSEQKVSLYTTSTDKLMIRIAGEFILPDSIEGIREGVKNGLWTEDDIIFSTQRGHRLTLGDKVKAKVTKVSTKGGKTTLAAVAWTKLSAKEQKEKIAAAKAADPKGSDDDHIIAALNSL